MKKRVKYPKASKALSALKETAPTVEAEPETMVRTQIYLSREEHAFLQAEAKRRDQPMAAVIRDFVDEKMTDSLPDEAWTNNPIFKPWPTDPTWEGHEDSGINHDHYIYGCPKKWIKVKGEWVESPPLPEDYYENRKSAEAYDRKLRRLDESK